MENIPLSGLEEHMSTEQQRQRIVYLIYDLDLFNFRVQTSDWFYSGMSLIFSGRIKIKLYEPSQLIQVMIIEHCGGPGV